MTERWRESYDEILDIAVKAGMLVLQNGGETYRTEETMLSVATSLGAESASAFVTPTVVMLTCVDADGKSHTRIQRITERSINLGKISRVNELSRRLFERKARARGGIKADAATGSGALADEGAAPRASLAAVESVLARASRAKPHHPAGVILATGIASLCFSLMFRGSFREAAAAFAVGALMRVALYLVQPLGLSGFFVSAFGGFVISALSGLAALAGAVGQTGNVSIAVLMSLVPGLAIVNAIRDIIAGDLVAGSARLMEAFVVAAALSLGAAFGLVLFPANHTYVSAILTLNTPFLAFALAFFATAAFAYFFHISRYDILWSSLAGGAGWLAYLVISLNSGSQSTAYMAGALLVGMLAELFAVLFRKPATVFIVPGIIPLVPGGGMYETMLMAVLGRMDAAATVGFSTLTAAGAIAVGIAIASSFARLVSRARGPSGTLRR